MLGESRSAGGGEGDQIATCMQEQGGILAFTSAQIREAFSAGVFLFFISFWEHVIRFVLNL